MKKQKIPGISLAIIQGGQIIYGRGYGYSNIEHQVRVKLETIFQSGSIGKQFTSMAIMMLVEDGKIQLDATINTYFADVPNEWNNITVRHLLTHTSGMTDYPQDFNYRIDYTEDDMYNLIKTIPLAFQPGEQWAYSNIGYVMLGILIRRVTNQFYGDFLKQYVFNPLNMTTARVISEADIILNRAAGYVLVNSELKNQVWVAPSLNTFADGALYLNIYDMAKWDAALYGDKLLKHQASFDEMWRPVQLNNNETNPYGFGWRLSETINGMRIVQHGGSWQGFRAMIIRVLDAQLTVVLFTNFSETDIEGLTSHVLKLYNPQLAVKPKENKIH
ncbi:unnamed protein product [Rotaria sordida]|uniref:Beta-lactamase-related domain-containing protein n=1 Tax=Rotaria sordida TaxID=392033 RepID=A0A814T427_9BILA|nr:unnamed protein product [Rotaria sordida]CAF1455776.1 unnamed protein product [Rotaria sordida]CAF4086108.1 unnamed protein product [Rotaria sordida]CAF4134118.1 unnamed protein product [Rotaria sordida]